MKKMLLIIIILLAFIPAVFAANEIRAFAPLGAERFCVIQRASDLAIWDDPNEVWDVNEWPAPLEMTVSSVNPFLRLYSMPDDSIAGLYYIMITDQAATTLYSQLEFVWTGSEELNLWHIFTRKTPASWLN